MKKRGSGSGNGKLSWTGKSYGGYFGNLCFLALLKIGMFPAYILLFFVTAYFMVFRPRASSWGARWLSRVKGVKVRRISLDNWRFLYSFGSVLLDRTAFMMGSGKIVCDASRCRNTIDELTKCGKGLVVVTAHVGAWEMAASLLPEEDGKSGIIGASSWEDKIAGLLEKHKTSRSPAFIGDMSDTMSIVSAYGALKRGGIVAMHCDRYSGGRFVEIEFFGSKIKAPVSAYALAAKAGVPVLQIACVRRRKFEYAIEVFAPIFPKDLKGAELEAQYEACARSFFGNLEDILRRCPMQWFNFYDFWEEGGK